MVTLCDYLRRKTMSQNENNRDGHNENISYNHGVEGETDDEVPLTAAPAAGAAGATPGAGTGVAP